MERVNRYCYGLYIARNVPTFSLEVLFVTLCN